MSAETIILVHGLWMMGAEMSLLKRRLRAHGYAVHQFRYRMMAKSLDHNCAQLKEFIEQHSGDKTHIVGHSLGGVLALQTLQAYPELLVSSVICLGSPLVDSAAGRRVSRVGAGRVILGKTMPEAVFETPLKEWSGQTRVGVVAGNSGFGLGKMIGKLPKPNDGVVALAETCLPGITDHLEVSVSHTGLILSTDVARQCHWFIRHGSFQRP